MLTDFRLLLLLKQMNDCSKTVSSNVQNQELLKALRNIKCEQCKHCNDDMESLAKTIRNTLLEVNEIQEKNRERRHREILALVENYLRKNEQQVPSTSACVETDIDSLQHYKQQQAETTSESLTGASQALTGEGSSNVDEEITKVQLLIPQDTKNDSIEIKGLATYLGLSEATSILNSDARTEINDLKGVLLDKKSICTKSETRNKNAARVVKTSSNSMDKAIDDVSTQDILAVALQREEYRDRRRKNSEGNYESLRPITKRSCNTILRTTNEVPSETTINDCTKASEASNMGSEGGLVKESQGIEDPGVTTGQILVSSRKWLSTDAENRGAPEITRDEFTAMRNEMFAKQRQKMEDRERKYSSK